MTRRRPDTRARGPHAAGDRDEGLWSQGRIAALVIVAAMILWMGLGWLGGQLDWPARFVFLLDLAVMAALVWALVVLIGVWVRRRREDG